MIRSEADGIVITDILLAPVTMSGLKHNVQSPMSGSLSATVTNSIIKISEVGVQLSEWLVKLHLYVRQFTYRCGKTVANATFSANIGGTSEFLLRNAHKQITTIHQTLELFSDVGTRVTAVC